MKWLTNKAESNALKTMRELQAGNTYKVVIGDPKATDWFTAKQLKDMGMVGLYAAGAKA